MFAETESGPAFLSASRFSGNLLLKRRQRERGGEKKKKNQESPYLVFFSALLCV